MLSAVTRQMQRAWGLYRDNGAKVLAGALFDKARSAIGMPPAGRADYLRFKAAEDAAFDGDHGVDTGGVQMLGKLTIRSDNAARGSSHIATPPREFDAALPLAEQELGDLAGASFVDLGSGKGRALLMAAERGYGRIVGVEFAAELDAVARGNVLGRADRARFTLIHGDAADYDLPAGPVLLYLFHPFDSRVMVQVARRALASWQRDPRPVRVVYLNPQHPAEWLQAGWREVASTESCVVYAPVEP